jgi:hypothetical protein
LEGGGVWFKTDDLHKLQKWQPEREISDESIIHFPLAPISQFDNVLRLPSGLFQPIHSVNPMLPSMSYGRT